MRNVILVCLLIVMAGCASRKKELHQYKKKYDFSSRIDTTFSFVGSYLVRLESKEQEQSSSFVTKVNYEGKKGDSLSIKKFGPDGKLQSETLITGSGKADITEEKSSSSRAVQTNSDLRVKVDETASGHHKEDLGSKEEGSSKLVTTEGLSLSFWLACLFIVLILIGRWYLSRLTKNGV